MFSKSRALFGNVVAAGALAVIATAAQAEDVDFSGETIELIAPYTEGGGADTYARMFVPYLKKYLPGNPDIIVRNLPGGASIMGNNRFQADAEPDGLTLVVTSSSTLVAQLFGGDRRDFDVLKWRQIVVTPQGTVIYASTRTGVTGEDPVADVKVLQDGRVRYGAKQPDAGELRNILGFELLDLNPDVIFGLARGEVRQAMLRGEMELNHDTAGRYSSSVKQFVERGDFVPLWTLGLPKGGKIVRDPVFPDLPTISEVYTTVHGEEPSGELYDAFRSFVSLGVAASKGFALPEGTPDEIRDAYVDAVQAAMEDPDFIAASGDEVLQYPSSFAADADAAVRDAVGLTPAVNKWLLDYLEERFDFTM